jgi:hypothetical protein
VTLKIIAFRKDTPKPDMNSLAYDLADRLTLDDDHLSDIDVVAGDKIFHCHKVILASRSDVFGAMFSHDNVKECLEGKIVLEDDTGVVELFLQYIYTDDIAGSLEEDKAVQVLIMADRYNVPKMKET